MADMTKPSKNPFTKAVDPHWGRNMCKIAIECGISQEWRSERPRINEQSYTICRENMSTSMSLSCGFHPASCTSYKNDRCAFIRDSSLKSVEYSI